ncbi:phosphoribosyltransferase [Cerasicoccus fimbriatus]|uniref:phosphoribosyltransferase n=1 Tax=Cerasicoccus fimbriatus TaxID=3014554 RepID=UPI0022B5D665|nr:phosphoribosyltransferase family protein [Cerasicoccus sp. TK19100]
MDKEFLSWAEFGELVSKLTAAVTELHEQRPFDRIVGISRGGLPIGVSLSHRLNLPFTPVEVKSYKADNSQGDIILDTPQEVLSRCRGHVLLVDDLADSGKTTDFLMSHLRELTQPEITIATLYYKRTSIVKPQFYVEETAKWIVFPWEA